MLCCPDQTNYAVLNWKVYRQFRQEVKYRYTSQLSRAAITCIWWQDCKPKMEENTQWHDTESFAVDDWDNPETYLESAVVQHQDWEIQR